MEPSPHSGDAHPAVSQAVQNLQAKDSNAAPPHTESAATPHTEQTTAAAVAASPTAATAETGSTTVAEASAALPRASPDGGFVYEGRWYAGVAARRPVFIPPDDFFVPQPQLWTKCTCVRNCFRCVYDGELFCEACRAAAIQIDDGVELQHPCDCEPGCCGVPGSTDGSESEASGS